MTKEDMIILAKYYADSGYPNMVIAEILVRSKPHDEIICNPDAMLNELYACNDFGDEETD